MRYWITIIFLFATTSEANTFITVGEFLQQAQEDASRFYTSGTETQPHGGNSWIEDAEIRYSDDNDSNDKRSLALRFQPKGFGQKSAEDTILSLRQRQRTLMSESALNESLKQRYAQLLELVAEQLLVYRMEKQIALSVDEGKLQHDLAFTKEFRPENLLQMELRADKLRNKIKSHRKRLLDMRTRLRINQIPADIVTIDDMLAVIELTPELPINSDVQAAKLELEIAQQQRKLDRAKRGVALSLLEFKQERAAHKDDVLGMTLGIRIPLGSNYSSSRSAYDVTDAMYNLQLQQRTQQRNIVLESDMLRWQKVRSDTIKQTLDGISKRIHPAVRSGNTELLLALKRQQLKEKEKLADIHQTALRHYINYLSISGQLAKAPLRNWLLPGQPVL